MLDSLYEAEITRVLDDAQARPRPAPRPRPSFWAGIWSAAPRGVGSGALKAGATGANIATAYGNVVGAFDPFGATVVNRTDPEKVKREREEALAKINRGEIAESQLADDLRQVARSVRPDPQTTGTAAQIVGGVADIVTQATIGTLTSGPVGAVAVPATSEGAALYDELREQGVDPETAAKVGLLRAGATAAAVALPVAGHTALQTAGLVAAGGPVAFMAENAAAREILQRADYSDIAETFDPFDPVGLAVSTVTAGVFGFGAHLARGARGGGKGEPVAAEEPAPVVDPRSEVADAARVVLAREQDAAMRLADPTDLAAVAREERAIDTAEAQMMAGERVQVAEEPTTVPQQLAEFEERVDAAIDEARAGELEAAVVADLTPEQRAVYDSIPREKPGKLTPEQRAIESRFAARIAREGFDNLVAEYSALPDSQGGKVLNTDIARELSPDYLADRTQSAAVHEPASWFIKRLYERKLAEAPKEGELPVVLFTAGGTGAGKSTGIESVPTARSLAEQAQIIYDTNMNAYDSAVAKLRQAQAAGKAARIVLVYRDPVDALVNGALPRAERQRQQFGTGRTVPIDEHVKTHVGAVATVKRIAAENADNPDVQVYVVDNSRGRGKAVAARLADIPDLEYDRVEPAVRAALEAEFRSGRISEQTYQGFAGRVEGQADAAAEGAARGVRQEDRPGDRRADQRSDEASARGPVAPEIEAALAGARRITSEIAAGRAALDQVLAREDLAPEVRTLAGALVEAGDRADELLRRVAALRATDQQATPLPDTIAQALESLRAEAEGGAAPEAVAAPRDPVAELLERRPDLDIELDVDGQPVRGNAAEVLRAVEEKAMREAADAELLNVAAYCMLEDL